MFDLYGKMVLLGIVLAQQMYICYRISVLIECGQNKERAG